MIKISNLHKFYGKNSNKIEVLKGIDLSFDEGKMCIRDSHKDKSKKERNIL